MIKLDSFDKEYLKSLEGHEKIQVSPEGVYHTIILDGQKAGIVGFIPAKFPTNAGFVQTIIAPDFRGRGLSGQAKELLVKKHDLKVLYATILQKNAAAIRSCQKSGFKMLPEKEQAELRQKGLLKKDQLRMVKKYK